MMDKLYYHYNELLLIWGIIGLIVKTCIFSGMIIYENVNDINEIVCNFKIIFINEIFIYICFYIFKFFLYFT